MQELYQKKKEKIFSILSKDQPPAALYEALIVLGKTLPSPKTDIQLDCFLVDGCQGIAYLSSSLCKEGKIWYEIKTEALISAGLAALLLLMYHGEPVELILSQAPIFLRELRLETALSPGRSNGLFSLYSRMKQDALILQLRKKSQDLNDLHTVK